MSGDSKDSGVGGDISVSDLALESNSANTSTSETAPPILPAQSLPSQSRARYNSPLSSMRNNYKPPIKSPDFKPISFSSPKCSMMLDDHRAAEPSSPSLPTANVQTVLDGRGGEWRAPVMGDMQPHSRRFTPRGGQRGSPYNHPGNRRPQQFGRDEGNNSYGRDNSSFGGNSSSFGLCSGSPYSTMYSPYSDSQDNSRSFNNSKRESTGRNNSRAQGGEDIARFIHPSMTEDPWSQLVSEKRRNEQV